MLAVLQEKGHEVLDLGADSTDPVDYPDKALAVARAIKGGEADRGILVCGSGAGVSVAASKIDGIRAVPVQDTYTAHQMVEHDDINVICLGARVLGPELAADILREFLEASYTGEERHERRLKRIALIERDGLSAEKRR